MVARENTMYNTQAFCHKGSSHAWYILGTFGQLTMFEL